jgi:A/G-specific adenine glycosylase
VSQIDLATPLLAWYEKAARELPWRGATDPYAVWVSEIMLQQTRVDTVIPYFQRWMNKFPSITDLAQASLQDVLAAWEGLGYYGRARNLHKAAQKIQLECDGKLPDNINALRKLPGIGKYTAGAIASIAFGKDEPALDGNIRRVLSRCFNMDEPVRSPAAECRLWKLAAEHLPSQRAGDFNQALMDLGAQICTPRKPQCNDCPLTHLCAAYSFGIQEELPVIPTKPAIPHYLVTAAVIRKADQVLIAQRPNDGFLGGLWEFPGGKLQAGENLAACLKREILEELAAEIAVEEPIGVYRHAYTHFRVTLHAFFCSLVGDALPSTIQVKDLKWVSLQQLFEYPMGKIDRQISKDLINLSLPDARISLLE